MSDPQGPKQGGGLEEGTVHAEEGAPGRTDQ